MDSVIFITLAAICNSIMDVLSFRYDLSLFSNYPQYQQFFDVRVSWKNKYKNGDPEQGAKFFGSETFFVFLTDGWHLAKFFMIIFFSIAAVVYSPILGGWKDVLLFYTLFTCVFQLFFARVLIK